MGWPSSLALGVVVMLLVIVSMHSGTLLLLTRHFDRMDRHVDAKLSLLHESMRQKHIAPVLASTNELNATLRLVEQRSSTMQRELAHARRSAAAVGEHVQALLSQKQKDAETLRNLTRDTRHLEHRLSVYGAMLQTYQEKSNATVSSAALLAAKRTTANVSLRTTSSDARSVAATAAHDTADAPRTGRPESGRLPSALTAGWAPSGEGGRVALDSRTGRAAGAAAASSPPERGGGSGGHGGERRGADMGAAVRLAGKGAQVRVEEEADASKVMTLVLSWFASVYSCTAHVCRYTNVCVYMYTHTWYDI